MTEPAPGRIETVQREPDGRAVYTHGHRYPDNVQVVEQHHDADGTLRRARVTWSGLAGAALDVTATFDAQGKVVKEEGHRAPDMTTPVAELIRPLPPGHATATTAPATAPRGDAPAATPDTTPLAASLRAIFTDGGDA